MMDRKWSSYGSDGEPVENVDDDDEVDETGDSDGRRGVDVVTTNYTSPDNLEDNDNGITLTAAVTSAASLITSKSSSVTPSGDVKRPRTTADGCEDDDGAGALDLIRHVLLPAARPYDSPNQSTSWKALDGAMENSVEELDSYVNPQSLIVDSH